MGIGGGGPFVSKATEPNQQSHFAIRIPDNRAAMIQRLGTAKRGCIRAPVRLDKKGSQWSGCKVATDSLGAGTARSKRSFVADRPIAPEAVLLHFWALTHTMARDHS
jgi:hypothetical protein